MLSITGFGHDNARIEMGAGVLNVLLGRNGAGKSALCRLIAGLDAPEAVRIELDGRDLTAVDTRRRNLGLVFGEFVNYPGLTVAGNIATPLRAAGVPKQERTRRVAAMAERTGLGGMLDRLPEELSGGQQQRLALARAMVKQPDLLLLDEPLVNLDYKLRERMEVELRELFTGSGTVVVYTSSDPREALHLADHLVLLHAGAAVAQGRPLDLLRAPPSAVAADLLCDPGLNLVSGAVRAGRLLLDNGAELAAPAGAVDGEALAVGIRPDHLRPVAQARAGDLRVDALVQVAETTGSDSYLHLRVGDVHWVAHLEGLHVHAPGDRVQFAVHAEDLLMFPAAAVEQQV